MSETRPMLRRLVGTCAVLALAAGGLATGAMAAPDTTRPRVTPLAQAPTHAAAARRAEALGVPGTVRYAVAQPVCAKPEPPDFYSCFAVRRKPVAKSTPGAFAYVSSSADPGPAGGYTPADLAGAYGYNPKTKVKQTVAIVDWYDDPAALSDLKAFDKHYGFAAETTTSFRKVNQNGRTSPLPKADPHSSGEITLDVQSVRAVCRTCRILLVEATSPTDANLAKAENEAVHLGATEVTNSYGEPESAHLPTAKTAQAYNHPGVVITASTGDEGWYGWDYALATNGRSQSAASFPSSDSAVVAVGGTAIGITNHKRTAEVVWNEDAYGNSGATGGGCSQKFTAAAWQKNYANYKAAGCQGARLAADVSAIADPATGFDIYQSYGGTGWETVGGTSLSSPVTAAMWALVGGAHGAAYPGSALYVNAQVHPSSLFDVTAYDPTHFPTGNSICAGMDPSDCDTQFGSNPNGAGAGLLDCSLPFNGKEPADPPARSRECNVAKGLDGPTGLGTPRSLRLFQATTPTLSFSGPGTVTKGKRATFHAKAKEIVPRTKVTGYKIRWGDDTTSSTKSGSTSHVYKKAGTHIVTVFADDSRYQETVEQYRVTVRK